MKKKKRKSSLSPETLELARRYEIAWHKFYYELPRFKQEDVVNEPDGRAANELAHAVRVYVDTNEDLKN